MQAEFVVFKLMHYSNLGGILPESGVSENDISTSLVVFYITECPLRAGNTQKETGTPFEEVA